VVGLLGYARVSTGEQDLALQLDALKAAGAERVFSDTASGSLRERPELARVLDHLRDGQDTLVAWRLDRLGRSLRHLIDTIAGLEQREVGFRSLSEGIDTTSPSGRLVFHVFGALAQFERELIGERTRAGLAAARARGRRGGRPLVMTEDKRRVARELLAGGEHTMAQIAGTLGVGRATLYRHLQPDRASAHSSSSSVGASGSRRASRSTTRTSSGSARSRPTTSPSPAGTESRSPKRYATAAPTESSTRRHGRQRRDRARGDARPAARA